MFVPSIEAAASSYASIPVSDGYNGTTGLVTVSLKNAQAVALPLTGLFLTNWQYVVGGLLAFVAITGILVIMRRKNALADIEESDNVKVEEE